MQTIKQNFYYVCLLLLLILACGVQMYYDGVASGAQIVAYEVIPGGDTVGVSITYKGVLVVGFNDIEDNGERQASPAKKAGVRVDDVITSINNVVVNNTGDVVSLLQGCGADAVQLHVQRDGTEKDIYVKPMPTSSGNKVGMWVRDTAAGIGTVTFYDPQTGKYAALGHGVTDVDTGKMVDIAEGTIMPSTIVGIDKGERGHPGQLRGIFDSSRPCCSGHIALNEESGIYGSASADIIGQRERIQTAEEGEITTGEAEILCNLDNNGVRSYSITIQKILPKAYDSNKSMIIRVTDPALLNMTGGIIQGMSGCPIIQNGRLVGAVTHVFVNDPTRGYGTLITHMLKTVNE